MIRSHLLSEAEETSRDEFMQCSYATRTKNVVGMGSMLDSGAATTKPGPAYMARGFHSISSSSSSVSMSLLPVLLLSPSSSALVCGGRCFLCTSQRSADDAQLIVHVLLTRGDVLDDDDEAGLAAFLCASHLSTESARRGLGGGEVTFLRGDPCPALLLTLPAERGPVDDDADDEAEGSALAGLVILRASHLSSESARLGLASGFGRTAATHGGVGSSGSIFHLGGVGSSAGRAACAMARCTRATGIAMDRRRRRAHQKAKGAAPSELRR